MLREGRGIWGTPFVVTNALPRAPHRRHDVQIIHRAGYTQPEIHWVDAAAKWDIDVILDGSGSALIGGERVNRVAGRPPEEQRPQLKGAQQFRVTKGDIRSRSRARLAPGAGRAGTVDHLRPHQRHREIVRRSVVHGAAPSAPHRRTTLRLPHHIHM
jgi:hypothetical protein